MPTRERDCANARTREREPTFSGTGNYRQVTHAHLDSRWRKMGSAQKAKADARSQKPEAGMAKGKERRAEDAGNEDVKRRTLSS